ncbi:MAG TPA: hypothetical protein VFS43_16470 [Polyangiaceae bacterium]|nr:hypothetical protein [Polyangiaceae bacterium]
MRGHRPPSGLPLAFALALTLPAPARAQAPAAPAASAPASPAPASSGGAPDLSADEALARGAAALARGAPREAIELYEAFADAGGLHPDVSYSRGAAYVARVRGGDDRPGDLGRAAAAFEETLALRPDDPDAPHALDVVRSAVAHRRARGGKAIEIDTSPGAFTALVGLLSEQSWALLAAAGSLSLSAGLAAWLRGRDRPTRLGGAIAGSLGLLALALGAAFALSAQRARTRGERAVVVAPELRLTNDAGLPLPGSPTLPEAAGVELLERRGALARVRWGKIEGWGPLTGVQRLPRPE